jgi:AraC family transcriptional regulator
MVTSEFAGEFAGAHSSNASDRVNSGPSQFSKFAGTHCWNDFDSVNNDPALQDKGRWPNFLHLGYTRDIRYPEHSGPLSVKCAFRGLETYEIGRRRYEVTPERYLILNNGQRYASSIQTQQETESFVVFFRPRFAETVLSGLIVPSDRLLNDPQYTLPTQVTFFEGMYPHRGSVSALLLRMRQEAARKVATPGWFEEQFHLLLEQLLCSHRDVCAQIEALPYKRMATRVEIYRRLYESREFIEASYAEKIDLAQMAGVACLSPHHFLRLFKQAFNQTPHQYLTSKRLDTARHLLSMTDDPVTDICFSIGFESLGSFSKLFHDRFGMSPSLFRKQKYG